jgi:hypothetical protein
MTRRAGSADLLSIVGRGPNGSRDRMARLGLRPASCRSFLGTLVGPKIRVQS